MAEQKAVHEPKKGRKKARDEMVTDRPKGGKQKRSKDKIDNVKKAGIAIASIAGAIIALSSIKWTVSSQTLQDIVYVVRLGSNGLICECPANAGGKKICKHSFGVSKLIEKEWWYRARKRVRIRRHGLRCVHCKSRDIIKNGRRRCRRKGLVQRYKCKSCRRTFSGMDGFRGRHLAASIIVEALFMVGSKMSADEVRRELKLRGIYVHETTIAKWTGHYSKIMSEYSATLRVDAGHQWHVDEIFVKIFGVEGYLFGVIDGASRFILSHEMSRVKQGFNPTNLFTSAAALAVRLPRILVSDGLHDFRKPAKKVFYRAAGSRFVHIREIHIQNIFNQNNVYESLNGEFEARLRCARGIKSMDSPIIMLMIAYHNFFREHTGLKNNMTPAEAIGIDIVPVEDSDASPDMDRWITFIQNSAISVAAA